MQNMNSKWKLHVARQCGGFLLCDVLFASLLVLQLLLQNRCLTAPNPPLLPTNHP